MEIQKILKDYLDVSMEMGNDSATSLIKDFIEKNSNNRYELPLIGQFSSGKSATLNHLLGRNMLPTKSIETTAFPTYISYSETEYAVIEMCDGTCVDISFEDIKQFDNNKVVNEGKQIKAMEIGIPCELLKSGLTFVDTPGVNTIITSHIEITERILETAQCIIYVIAKTLTDEDVLMIKTIEAHNIPVFYVRTHIDDIKSTEEDWRLTIRENEKSIAERLGHPIHFFAISNDTSRSEFNENFEVLKQYLSKDICENIKGVFEKAMLERLIPVKKELEDLILIRKQTLEQTAGKSIEEIQEQKLKIENLVAEWNEKMRTQQILIGRKSDEISEEVKQIISKCAESRTSDFYKVVDNSDGNVDSLNRALNQNVTKAYSTMNVKAEECIQDGANSVCRRLSEEMVSIGGELQTIGYDGDFNFDMSVARDYAERQKSIDEEYNAKVVQLDEIKERLSKQNNLSQQARAELESAISMAENEIRACQTNIETVTNAYEPKYIVKQSQLAPIGKSVGKVLDIAMLLIPSSGWTSVGKWASNIGKSGSKIRKVGEFIGKGADVLAKTDKAKDMATLLGGLKGDSDKSNGEKDNTSVFDYVSLSYWLEQVGEHIDPTTCEIDKQYEQQYLFKLRSLESELQDAMEAKKTVISNLAKFNGEQWKLEQEKLEAEAMKTKLLRETDALKSKMEMEKARAVRDSLLSQVKNEFKKRIDEYTEMLIRRSLDLVESVFTSLVDAADLKINGQLTSLSEQLADIVSNQNEYILTRDQKMFHFDEMMSKLNIQS